MRYMVYNFFMTVIEKKASDTIKKFVDEKPIVVALSGGRDSVCLLDMLCRYGNGLEISALHVNHHLRPESEQEAIFVKELCDGYGIKLQIFDIDVMAERNGRSVETAARDMRHEIYKKFIDAGKKVAVAHHALDRAETVLMHILRGSGVEGLVGMSERDGDLIRPILDFMPEELDEYVALFGLRFVTDGTNFDSTYDRNFVRLQVLPLISQRYPVVKSLIRLSENASRVEQFASKHLDYSVISFSGEVATIGVENLAEPYSAYKYVLKILHTLGLKKDYTATHVESVIALSKCNSGAKFSFLGIEAIREFDRIRICKLADKPAEQKQNIDAVSNFGEGVFDFLGHKLKISRQVRTNCATKSVKKNTIIDEETFRVLAVDGDKIPDGAVIRTRREGDVFRPYGGGEKKLKKYFIDKKIALSKRDILPIIAVGNRVLVIAGVEISDEVKCDKQTKNALTIEITD